MYTARRFDSETGLYYYRARTYSPKIGRFLQPDPIGYSDGLNMYAYVGNNPMNFVDPWGLKNKDRNMRRRDKFVRFFWNGVYYMIPKEKYLRGTQKICGGVSGICGGTAAILASGGAAIPAVIGGAGLGGGVTSLGVGGGEVLIIANGGPMIDAPTSYKKAVGYGIGAMSGNEKTGMAIGGMADALMGIGGSLNGLAGAEGALDLIDGVAGVTDAVLGIAGETDSLLEDDKKGSE